MSTVRLCVARATGWTGRAVADAVAEAEDLELRSAVSRSAAGGQIHGAPVHAAVSEALDRVDVLIDYTSHEVVKANALAAIERGVAVVIGASRLSAADFEQIDAAARERAVGVIAAGNFSRHGAGGGAAGGAPPAVVGGDRLRRRPQARRPQRHRSGAARAARPGPPARG
jgi:4-hydroxy-tetrahydrodipicolinate reductase